jgi:hypothetical protein
VPWHVIRRHLGFFFEQIGLRFRSLCEKLMGCRNEVSLRKHRQRHERGYEVGVSILNDKRLNKLIPCVISGFRHCANEIFAFLVCFAAYIGSYRRFGTRSPRISLELLDPWRWDGYIVPKRRNCYKISFSALTGQGNLEVLKNKCQN